MKTPLVITCLGHGHALQPSAIGNSAYLLEYGTEKILLDCGSTVPEILPEFGINAASLTAIIITHLHADHCGGLENLLYSRRYINKTTPIPLIMGVRTWRDWKRSIDCIGTKLYSTDYVTQVELPDHTDNRENRPITQIQGDITIEALHANHGSEWAHMNCYSFLITAGPHRVVFSGDRVWRHEGDEPMHKAMAQADLVLHELNTNRLPSGVHTHVSDIPNPSEAVFERFRWHHHGTLPFATSYCPFNLIFKGEVIRL